MYALRHEHPCCPGQFWAEFIEETENRLRINGVKSRGCAEGDLALGEYASIRNEAYVKWVTTVNDRGELLYPPNAAGFNAAGHFLPDNVKAILQHFDAFEPFARF